MLSSCHREGQSIHSCLFRDSQPPGIPSKALNRGGYSAGEWGGDGEKRGRVSARRTSKLHNSSNRAAFQCVRRYVVLLEGGGGGEPGSVSNFVLHKGPTSSRLFRNIKTLAGCATLSTASDPLQALCPWSDSWEQRSLLTIGSHFWCHICTLKPTL